MSYINNDNDLVGKNERGELFRDLTLISEFLKMISGTLLVGMDGVVSAGIETARRKIDNLVDEVGP